MAPKASAEIDFIMLSKVQSPSWTSTLPYPNAIAHITTGIKGAEIAIKPRGTGDDRLRKEGMQKYV